MHELRRRVRKLATWFMVATGIAACLSLVALEVAYQVLLPRPLPEPAPQLASGVRGALWLDTNSSLPPRLPFAYPFVVSLLLAEDLDSFALPSHVAKRHIAALEARGLWERGRHVRNMLRELALATWVSRHWTAEQALDALGALVYLGDNQHGLAGACHHYFGKPLAELEPEELALLAALVKSPHALHPACHPDRALAARNDMLRRMQEAGLLDSQTVRSAVDIPMQVLVDCSGERVAGHVG